MPHISLRWFTASTRLFTASTQPENGGIDFYLFVIAIGAGWILQVAGRSM
jgi:hypothetical protein